MNAKKENLKRKLNPVLKANFLSKWFYLWTRHIFKKGLSEPLESHHLYENIPYLNSEEVTKKLAEDWTHELQNKKPNLMRVIFLRYGWKILPPCLFYSAVKILITTLQPLFLATLISYFSPGQRSVSQHNAYLNAFCVVVANFLLAFVYNYFMFHTTTNGIRLRLALAGLVYAKCLQFPITKESGGQTAVAFSVIFKDLPQLDTTFPQIHNLWKGPIETFLFAYVMWHEIGWMSTLGIALIYTFLPLQIWAAKAAGYYRSESAKFGDERSKLMNEIITAMQTIKMYAWESCFAKIVAQIRKSELKYIRGAMRINAGIYCSGMISQFALIVSLMCYVYTGKVITSSKIFMASTYYVTLNKSLLHFWTMAITSCAETVVCLKRVNEFLLTEVNCAGESQTHVQVHADSLKKELRLLNVSASWDEKPNNGEHIRRITCHFGERQFVGITGAVGAGKSTLLHAILGELKLSQGQVSIKGSMSYAPQESWLFEGSIRDNIVFVEPFDGERYKAVLKACELERDLQLMSCGDATTVGERGFTLSGGQKARINLARAMYRKADIYLFDDPFAAVDTIVGKKLLEKCFMTFLRSSIRVLVTHHIDYMEHVDHVIVMDGGSIKAQGTYSELTNVIRQQFKSDSKKPAQAMMPRSKLLRASSAQSMKFELGDNFDKVEETLDSRKEFQMEGSVKFKIYIEYFKALQLPLVVFSVLAMFVFARICRGVMDVYLSKWATSEDFYANNIGTQVEENYERRRTLAMYATLIVSTFLLQTLQTFGFLAICLKISSRLHNKLYSSVARAFMLFFENNPSGRILNRFSSDLWRTDIKLSQAMLESFTFFVEITAVLCIVGMTNYWLLLPAAVMLILLYISRAFYIRSARNLQRVESITCSPVYTHVNQTFQGLTTIRALQATQQLATEFHEHQNLNTSAVYLSMATNRALALWIDLMCGLYICLVCFSFLVFERNFKSGDVGLAITQSSMLLVACQWGIRRTVEMENYMTSVERIMEYIDAPKEPEAPTSETLGLKPDWPDSGRICFKNVRFRYSAGSPYVLKGLNVVVRPGEKIGIVGRTGAGKSSIVQALFRLAINEGNIEIDGFDIALLGLHDLRSRLSIIPQEPVLFSGSLRFNLDPFGQMTDEQLWQALDDVKLKALVGSLDGGLHCSVYDAGANFSTGQRQLISLARAILRRNKILIMDEATASVDLITDKLIQQTIRTKFSECTVLTIAHRLHTVTDSDRVLVLDAGHVVDFEHPHLLLTKKRGHLYMLVEKTGYEMAEQLKHLAAESFNSRHLQETNEDETKMKL